MSRWGGWALAPRLPPEQVERNELQKFKFEEAEHKRQKPLIEPRKSLPRRATELNIDPSYCLRSKWNPASGVRELIQNLWDGVMEKHKLTPEDLDVEESTEGKEVIIFRIYEKKTGALSREAGYGCLASIVFTPPGEHQPLPLAVKRAVQAKTLKAKRHTCKTESELELINYGVTLSRRVLRIGSTSKRRNDLQVDSHIIGGHGEGMKVGINALCRDKHSVTISTDKLLWKFIYKQSEPKSDKSDSDDEIGDSLMVKYSHAPIKDDHSYAHNADVDLRILITGLKVGTEQPEHIDFDRFLFLRPPVEVLSPKDPTHSGVICLEPKYVHRLYVKGIFVCQYRETDLVLGYNILTPLQLNRDRDIPQDEFELCGIIWDIWTALFDHVATRDAAAKRYLEFFDTSSPPFETKYLEDFLEQQNEESKGRVLEICTLLFTTFCTREKAKHEGDEKLWVYEDSAEGGTAVRVIEDLGMIPVKAPKTLYSIWKTYDCVRSAESHRERLFRRKPLVNPANFSSSFSQHTSRLIDVFRQIHPATRYATYQWVDADDLDLDVVVDGLKVFLHSRNLDSVTFHSSHTPCTPFAFWERGDRDNDADFMCDCSANTLGAQIIDQVLSEKAFKHLDSARQTRDNVAATYPRALEVKPLRQSPTGVTLTWSTHLMQTRLVHDFLIDLVEGTHSRDQILRNVDADPSSTESETPLAAPPNPSNAITSGHEPAQADNDSDVASASLPQGTCRGLQSAEETCPSNSESPASLGMESHTIDSEKNLTTQQYRCSGTSFKLPDIVPGRHYTVQVCADVPDWCTAWSAPLTFSRALDPVPNVKCILKDETLRVSFSDVPHAEEYEIKLHFQGSDKVETLITKSTHAAWPEILELPSRVEVTGISSNGVRSSESVSVDVLRHPGRGSATKKTAKPRPSLKAYFLVAAFVVFLTNVQKNIETGSPASDSDSDDDYDDVKEKELEKDIGPRRPRKRGSLAKFRRVDHLIIHNHIFKENAVFELVRTVPQSQGTHDRIVFEVSAMFEAISSSSSSYVQGVMYRLCSDYLDCAIFDEDSPTSAVPPHGAEVFLISFEPTAADEEIGEYRSVDLPVKEIAHVLKRVGKIIQGKRTFPETSGHDLYCSWIYSFGTFRQGESFTPLANIDEWAKPSMPSRLYVADFFSGAGGFSEGFRRAGFEVALGVDKDGHAATSWKLNHPAANVNWADVKVLIAENKKGSISLPDIQVALVSPPCQGFSTANPGGKNDEDNRGLFSCVGDIARSFNPYWICVENVPGLISKRNRVHLRKLVFDLLSSGYSVRWCVQSAADFGVPQTRKRVIIFAALLGLTVPNFPAPTHGKDSQTLLPVVNLRNAIDDLNHENPRADNNQGNPKYIKPNAEDPDLGAGAQTTALAWNSANEIHHHATGYGQSSWQRTKTWRKAKWDEPSCTVLTRPNNRWECLHPDGHRILTVRELCRIQSLPDSWHLSGPITEQYRQVGNAVPPLLSEALAREVRNSVVSDYPELSRSFEEPTNHYNEERETVADTTVSKPSHKRVVEEVEPASETEEEAGRSTKRSRVTGE